MGLYCFAEKAVVADTKKEAIEQFKQMDLGVYHSDLSEWDIAEVLPPEGYFITINKVE